MLGKSRLAWYLLFVGCALALIASTGHGAAAASQPPPTFTGLAEIEGPIHLQISVSPPVLRPGEEIHVTLTASNRLDVPVSPTIEIAVPEILESTMSRFPSGTAIGALNQTLSWQPVLDANGASGSLTLAYEAKVADISHPEQTIAIQLSNGDEHQKADVSFWVGSPPSARIVVDPPVVAVGQLVRLQAQAQGPGPFTATWDLGDGRHVTTREAEVAFALPGIYDIQLHLANPLSVATALSAVTVVAQPAANFTIDDHLPVAGQAVQFLNESGGERPLESHWFFGDGSESTDANPSHVYAAPGSYTAVLVVSSPYGESEFAMPIAVGVNPAADVVVPEQAMAGVPVEMRAFTDDSVTGIRWRMGDGAELEGELVEHTYLRPGEFTVTLFAANDYGETQVTRHLTVEGDRFLQFLTIVARPVVSGAVELELLPLEAAPISDTLVEPQETNTRAAELPIYSGPSPTPDETGGAAGVPLDSAQPITLPPQAELAADATVAEQLYWYVNEARRLHGLGPLAYNYELSIAAQQHTLDMSQNPDIMHLGSDGSRPADRQRLFGYLGAYGGEAVAWGWESPVPVVEFWVNSPPHRILILNPEADEIGVGHTADGRAPNIWYWAVEFGVLPGN